MSQHQITHRVPEITTSIFVVCAPRVMIAVVMWMMPHLESDNLHNSLCNIQHLIFNKFSAFSTMNSPHVIRGRIDSYLFTFDEVEIARFIRQAAEHSIAVTNNLWCRTSS